MTGSTIPGIDESEYRTLVAEFPPRPIRDEELARATEQRIEWLLTPERLSPAQEEYLDLLTLLLHEWEAAQVEIPRLSGIELVNALLDERGLPRRALVPIFGTPSIVSEVLAGKRELQRKHVEGLAEFFHVSPAAFFPAPARRAPESRATRVAP